MPAILGFIQLPVIAELDRWRLARLPRHPQGGGGAPVFVTGWWYTINNG